MTLAARRGRRNNDGMVRCAKCRFLFEAATPGLLPQCAQCGGATVAVIELEPFGTEASSPPTLKFEVVRTDSGGR